MNSSPWGRLQRDRDSASAELAENSPMPFIRDSTAMRSTPPGGQEQAQPAVPTVPQSIEADPNPINLITQEEKERRAEQRRLQKKRDADIETEIRLKEQSDFEFCRRRFLIGCFALPFLLLLNVIYFFEELKSDKKNFRVRKYVLLSLIVMLIQTGVWILWLALYQAHRSSGLSSLSILRVDLPIGFLA